MIELDVRYAGYGEVVVGVVDEPGGGFTTIVAGAS
jgi:hypothetical protein